MNSIYESRLKIQLHPGIEFANLNTVQGNQEKAFKANMSVEHREVTIYHCSFCNIMGCLEKKQTENWFIYACHSL